MYFQAHTACYKQLPVECSFGCLRQIMVPPYAVSVPRMDIAQEDLVRMPRKQGTCLHNYGIIALAVSGTGTETWMKGLYGFM